MAAPLTILTRLTEMAQRLGISSNQAILVYAAANNWTNLEMTAAAVNVLQKIAGDNKIDLYDETPFIQQLLERGILTESEGILFGLKKVKNPSGAGNAPAGTQESGEERVASGE